MIPSTPFLHGGSDEAHNGERSRQGSGEALSGTYEGQLGQANLKGTVKGRAINFSFTVDAQGQSADVTSAGTVESDGMEGSVDIAGQVSGAFTAKRQ